MTESSSPLGDGELVVQRGDDVVGALMPLEVVIDDEPVAALLPNQIVRLRVSEGDHRVRAGRSRWATASVGAGSTVFVVAEHPPMPSRWRLIFDPVRATRPTVRVTSGPVTAPGPGQAGASQVWLQGWAASFVSINIWMTVGLGTLLVAVGSAVAVLGRAEAASVVTGAAVTAIGFVTVAVGLRLRTRNNRTA